MISLVDHSSAQIIEPEFAISPSLIVVASLVGIIFAANLIVSSAARLAKAASISPLLIGLTIVAFGTSAPEFVVSAQAVANGASGIALGNIIGSNIANILLVLGVAATLRPISPRGAGVQKNGVLLVFFTAAFCGYAFVFRQVDVISAAILLSALVLYLTHLGLLVFRGGSDASIEEWTDEVEGQTEGTSIIQVVGLVLGLLCLIFLSRVLVDNAVILASDIGVREEVIGLSLIAFGTSVPELAAVVVAAVRREAGIAFGGIIGSNIFNLLGVAGAAGLFGDAKYSSEILNFDLIVMFASTISLVIIILMKRPINRLLGVVLVAAYFSYLSCII